MKLNVKNYTCLESFDSKLVSDLRNNYGVIIEGEVLDFLKNYPSLQLDGSSLVIPQDTCNLTDGILISDFLGLNQIRYLKKENFFDRFKYLMDKIDDSLIPLSFSMGENQLIIAKRVSINKVEIYILDDLCESICYVCDGVFNFINNHLDHEFNL